MRTAVIDKLRWAALGIFLLLSGLAGGAAPIRVASWNLQGLDAAGTNTMILDRIAATLRESNPDIVLLQHIQNWKMCRQLAREIKPTGFNVLICSAFGAQEPGSADTQTGILSKRKAYFSWSAPWNSSGSDKARGGLVFAAIEIENVRLGIFSVQLDPPSSRTGAPAGSVPQPDMQVESIRQILGQIESVRNWITNRVQAFVFGGGLGEAGGAPVITAQDARLLLEQSEFFDAFAEVPLDQRATLSPAPGHAGEVADYLFAQLPAVAAHPKVLSEAFLAHRPIVCEIQVNLARPGAQTGSPPLLDAGKKAAIARPAPQPEAPPTVAKAARNLSQRAGWTAIGAALALLLAGLAWMLGRTRRKAKMKGPILIPESIEMNRNIASGYTVVVAPRSVTGSGADDAPVSAAPRPVVRIETPPGTRTESALWRQRALAAEEKAEQATALMRRGLLPQLGEWLKHKLVRKLAEDRSNLLETQQAATLTALAVDERLSKIEAQINQQNQAYERRIEELTRELAAAKEENRELIRARIAQVKAEMESARRRAMAQMSALSSVSQKLQ